MTPAPPRHLLNAIQVLMVSIFFIGHPLYSQDSASLDSLRTAFDAAASDSARIDNLLQQANELMYENTEQAEKVMRQAITYSKKAGDRVRLVKSYNLLGRLYFETGRYNESIGQYSTALKLAREIEYNYGISEALTWLGNNYKNKGDYAKAKEYHLENMELCKKTGDIEGVANSYNNLGNISNELGDYTKAVEYYTESARLIEQVGNELSSAIALANIGMIQNRMENYDRSIAYFNQSNAIFKKLNYKPGINFVLHNLGIALKGKGELDKALAVYRQAIASCQEMNANYELAQLYDITGNIYWHKKKYDSAHMEYVKCLDLAIAMGDSTRIGTAHNAMGTNYYYQKNFHQAKRSHLKAKEIALIIHNPVILLEAEKGLHLTYLSLNDSKNAYQSYSAFKTIQDSLQGAEKNKLAKEIEARYQNEKKEKEIALLSSQNETKSLQIKKRDNERIYLLLLISILTALGLVMYRLYKIKNKAHRKSKELNRLQSSFFTNISHEFRTPLTLIQTALENKMELEKDGHKKHDNIVIQRNASRLLQLVNQLLDLSKLEAGSEKLQVHQVCVSKFLHSLALPFSPLAESLGISFTTNIQYTDIQGYLDTDKVEKMVTNLLSNAFKFTSEKGEVTLLSSIRENQLEIVISDTGIGIPPDYINRIFHRFYQVDRKDMSSYGGTGIGLALTKELVALHRGNIEVVSVVDQGTSFTITIPLQGYNKECIVQPDWNQPADVVQWQSESVFTGSSDPLLHVESGSRNQEDFLILLVEDNPDLLFYMSNSLAGKYKVLQARDGLEGYELAIDHIPDLIVSDLMMPRLDGKDMCQKVRGNDKTSHIPLIMLTAKADRESKLEGLEAGADDYLTKPFDARELHIKINNILLQRNRLQERARTYLLLGDKKINAGDAFIQKASAIINANLGNADFSIADFSKEMGYSRMQLHRKIKAISGHSANEFIRLIRLKKAAALLVNNYDQIAQIAYETGFTSPSYFTKCFKEVYRLTPREYVESMNPTSKILPRD